MNTHERRLLVLLFAIGLALRLSGLLFNGIFDVEQMVLVWGAGVARRGIGAAFAENYGFLSYLAFGAAAQLAELMPRFWWAPYKSMELLAEIGILVALFDLVPGARRRSVLVLYWLNPWFILHGAWLGFWDGPYVLAALGGVICLRRASTPTRGWVAFGALIATSGMLKPQGLIQLGAPIGIFLAIDTFRRGRATALVAYATGALALLLASTVFLVAEGASALAIPNNYLSAARAMPTLCNGCLNLWHPVTVLLQTALGQDGETWLLSLPPALNAPLHALAAAVTLALIGFFSWRLALRQEDPERALQPDRAVLLLLACASLVISSFGTMAHINHGYAALVFLIPFAVESRRLWFPWLALSAIAFLAHFTTFAGGRAQVRPDICKYLATAESCDAQWTAGVVTQSFDAFRDARPLIVRIHRSAARARGLLAPQAVVDQFAAKWLPAEPTLSLLSAGQAVFAIDALRVLFRLASVRAGR